MKYIYTLLAVMLLASCTASQTETNEVSTTTEAPTATEKTVTEIDAELSEIDTTEAEVEEVTEEETMTEEVVENNVVKLDATYTNPQTEVDMTISYTLDSEGKIETIEVAATTYDVTEFNNAAQVVIGKTIEEAKETAIAGGSLTTEAFKNALK